MATEQLALSDLGTGGNARQWGTANNLRGEPEAANATAPPAQAETGLPPFIINTTKVAHLMRNPRPPAEVYPVCLFQYAGDKCCGTLVNGLCELHWGLLNIIIVSRNHKIWTASGQGRVRCWQTCAQDAGPIKPDPWISDFFPFIEHPLFDLDTDLVVGHQTLQLRNYDDRITKMSAALRNILTQSDQDIIFHTQTWVDYMSSAYNVSKKAQRLTNVNTALETDTNASLIVNEASGPKLLELNKCTLLTQAIAGVFMPQIFQAVDGSTVEQISGPANVIIAGKAFSMNMSLIPFGTDLYGRNDDGACYGTNLRMPCLANPPLLFDKMVDRVTRSLEYKINESCTTLT